MKTQQQLMDRYQCISIDQIKKRNTDSGHHFFSKGTMKWFKSRTSSFVYYNPKDEIGFFVSSERQDMDSPRLYTVRGVSLITGIMNQYGSTFQRFTSTHQANEFIHTALSGHKEEHES